MPTELPPIETVELVTITARINQYDTLVANLVPDDNGQTLISGAIYTEDCMPVPFVAEDQGTIFAIPETLSRLVLRLATRNAGIQLTTDVADNEPDPDSASDAA